MIEEVLRVVVDDSKASPELTALAGQARSLTTALGASGVGGAAGQTGAALAQVFGLGGPAALAIATLGTLMGAAYGVGSALLSATRDTAEHADELVRLGRISEAEADAVRGVADALDEQTDAARGLKGTIAAELAPELSLLVATRTQLSEWAQAFVRQIGEVRLDIEDALPALREYRMLMLGGPSIAEVTGGWEQQFDQDMKALDELIRKEKELDDARRMGEAARERLAEQEREIALARGRESGAASLGNIAALEAGDAAGNMAATGAYAANTPGAGQARANQAAGLVGGVAAGNASIVASTAATTSELSGLWTTAFSTINAAAGKFFADTAKGHRAAAALSIASSTAAAIMRAWEIYGPTPQGGLAAAGMLATGLLQYVASEAGTMPAGIGGGAPGLGGGVSGSSLGGALSPVGGGTGASRSGAGGGGDARRRAAAVGGSEPVVIKGSSPLAYIPDLIEQLNDHLGRRGYGFAWEGR